MPIAVDPAGRAQAVEHGAVEVEDVPVQRVVAVPHRPVPEPVDLGQFEDTRPDRAEHDPAAGRAQVDRSDTSHGETTVRSSGAGRRPRSARPPGGRCRAPSGGRCRMPDHASVHSPGSRPKSTRDVVLPICSSGPGTTSPSDATSRNGAVRRWPSPNAVTGPCFTSNSTETPQPRLPWNTPSPRSSGSARADRQVGRPVVAHLDHAVAEVQRLQLGERAAARPAGP